MRRQSLSTVVTVMESPLDAEFPCSLTIDVPMPTQRLADAAKRALQVDQELSPLVRRAFSTVMSTVSSSDDPSSKAEPTIFRTEYKATTNRMLRVAVNGFMESLGVVLGIIEELDVDIFEDASEIRERAHITG